MSNYLKAAGIQSTERSWSDEKIIKNGKRANNGGEYLEKRAILYTSTKLEDAQLVRNWDLSNDTNYDVFGDDD